MQKKAKIAWLKIQTIWQSMNKKIKSIVIVGIAVALLLAITVPLMLRGTEKETVLYHNLSSEESSKIYSTLQEMSVNVSMNGKGEILVPKDQVNYLKLQMSALGYPKSSLSYDIFSSNAGFMSTELEKKQYLLMDLQNRLQETIRWIDGVNDAVVTLNIPQDSNYIWDSNDQQSTGSVMLAIGSTKEITSKQVQSIKNLVSSSVPKMSPDNVTIINASTGMELIAKNDQDSANMDKNLLQLQFEQEVEKKMEDKVLNLLTLPFGVNNVRVSASVVLDFDKMLSEEMQYIPELDGRGVMNRLEEWYSSNKDGVSSGIVGEENNTDVPIYPQIGTGTGEVDEFNNKAEYLVSYIKTQIERNNAITKMKTVSVVINNATLSTEDKDALVNTISKAANVNVEDVVVNNFMTSTGKDPIINPITGGEEIPLPYLIGGIAFAVLLLGLIVFLFINYRKKAAQLKELQSIPVPTEAELMVKAMEEQKQKERETEINHSSKTREVLSSIKDFSFENPEIAATLIRDLLREGD